MKVTYTFTDEERVSMSRGENTEETFKAALSRLSESNPGLRPAIEKTRKTSEIQFCESCGEPSRNKKCKKCELMGMR